MDRDRLAARLDAIDAKVGRPLTIFAETASTNDEARRAAAEGAPHGATFIADRQTAGRGRRGHSWHSPAGENIYLSVVLRPDLPPEVVAPLTLAVGVAVAGTVDGALGTARARIKWPNDVYVDDKKIAGVLVEGSTIASTTTLVVGVGLNVLTTAFPPPLDETATSLALAGANTPERENLAADLVHNIGRAAETFAVRGLAAFAAELDARDLLRDQQLRCGEVVGVGGGIDAAGRLRVRTADGAVRSIRSGEVIWTP